MKINIYTNDSQKTVIPGYINLSSLDTVEDGEASEIVSMKAVDYYGHVYVPEFLAICSRKLEHGGTLTISGTSLEILVKAFYRRDINTAAFNAALFGEQKIPLDYKSSCHNVEDICNILTQLGMQITERRIVGLEYIVKAVRP